MLPFIEARFLKACLLRATGNIPKAVDAFKEVLAANPGHLDAAEHLNGVTCGLLPSAAPATDPLVKDFLAGKYAKVVKSCNGSVGGGCWLLNDAQLVLLISSLTQLMDASALYKLGQELVEER